MTSSDSTSLAVFGSMVRGELDAYSDKDILIVEDDFRKSSNIKSKLSSKGWSCSSYSWGRLHHLVKEGSLFIQHLKTESLITQDPENRLIDTLSSFTPKHSYTSKREEALSLFELLSEIPSSPVGHLWAMDVISVGYRAAAIAELGNEGIYTFSHDKISEQIARVKGIRSNALLPLRSARRYKSLFRRGIYHRYPSRNELTAAVDALDKVLGLGMHSKAVLPHRFSSAKLLEPCQNNWYAESRRLEFLSRTMVQDSKRSVFADDDMLCSYLKRLQAPSEYGMWTKSNIGVLKQSIETMWENLGG